MAVNEKKKDLLETVADGVGCEYLSDLRYKIPAYTIKRVLKEIKPEQYSIEAWNDAVSYITGKDFSFESRDQALEYMKHYKE
ncbi:hypothetical protein [Frisingicoccus sp.]|uniref:hypothetical protein n=1 Tax=Frisingicoccus sp. TaxID=1918627 RepID=UPI002E77D356|nr:hypothetical protein [Frisingicoccus sp.]MEE0752886.1 hypothetical protein [Frisingicoccus sp.]